MPKYNVSFAVRVWIETEVTAKTEAEAGDKAQKRANGLPNSNGFCWLGGDVDICGITNLTLLNKIPM